MKKPKDFQKYLAEGQTTEMADAQEELDALGWTDYRVCYQKPEISGDGLSAIIWAMDEGGEIVVIKKMLLTPVKETKGGKKQARQTDTHIDLYAQSCKHIPEKRRFKPYKNYFFVATEFVEYDFDELKKKRVSGSHGLDEITEAFVGYSKALEYMHDIAQVVHRDINPSNLRFDIDENGDIVPKIIDFGLACGLDVSLSLTGKVGYIAPEIKREGVTSEIYSLGICLYEAISESDEKTVEKQQGELISYDEKIQEMYSIIEDKKLTHKEEESGKTKANIMRFHETRKPRDEIKYLFEVFKKATQPEPKDRYRSATAFKNDLRIALQHRRLDEIIFAFENASTASDKIKKGIPFDLINAEDASKLKTSLYDEFKNENYDLESSAVIAFVEAQIKEKIKPVKDAANIYLNKFRFTTSITSTENMDSYGKKIDNMLEAGDPAYRRNILEMVTNLKKFYDLCEMTYPVLFKILLESRALKRESLLSQRNASYDELLKKTENILSDPVIMEDPEYSESAVIAARLGAYTTRIKATEHTPEDIQHCIEIKELMLSQKNLILASDDKLCSKFDEFIQKMDDYISNASDEVKAPAFFNMGISSFNERDFNKSISYFEKASKIIPGNPNLEYNLGRAYHAVGDNINAKKQYRRARDIRSNQNASESINTLNNFAVLFAKAGMFEASRQMFEIISAEAPEDYDIIYNLATVCMHEGDSETAINLFEKVLAKQPSNEIHNFLAQEYFKVGDFAKFKEHTEIYAQSFIEKLQN